MPGSPRSFSSVLRSSFLLFLTVSLFVLLDSREAPQDHREGFLDSSYPQHLISSPLDAKGGPGGDFADTAFESKDGHTFPQQEESTFIMEDEAQTTRVWPRVILDYMRHQLRFRGRTKKSSKKDILSGLLDNGS